MKPRYFHALIVVLMAVSEASAQIKTPPKAKLPENSEPSKQSAGMATPVGQHLKAGVTNFAYDDIPSVLDSLKIPYRLTKDVEDPLATFNVIYFGCGSSEIRRFNQAQLRSYVEHGGVLYASDLAYPVIDMAFSDVVGGWRQNGMAGKYPTAVVDKGLAKTLGAENITLNFDLGGWAFPTKWTKNVRIMMTTNINNNQIPVLFTFTHGKGRVIYTAFHNHANASEMEQKLIKSLVAAPLQAAKEIQAEVKGTTIEELRKRNQPGAWSTAAEPLESLKNSSDEDRKELLETLKNRLPNMSAVELAEVLASPHAQPLHPSASSHLQRRWPKAGPLELLYVMEQADDAEVLNRAAVELSKRHPTFAEVKEEISGFSELLESKRPKVADGAREQLANAFQRAPIGTCLDWLGQASDSMAAVIWPQIDGRIARADAERKKLYRETALAVAADSTASPPTRKAALELLARLKEPLSVKPLADLLPTLPRELWASAGDTLRRITGASFGPHPGDGTAETVVAAKQWRQWAAENAP